MTMKKVIGILSISFLTVVGGFFIQSTVAYAQESEQQQQEQPAPQPIALKANAGEDRNVIVGRTVLFDASATTGPANAQYTYTWDFGDGNGAEGIDATHIYERGGVYRARLTVEILENGQTKRSSNEIIVSVQEQLMLLITDQSVKEEEIEELQQLALSQGVLLISLRDTGVDQEFQSIQNISSQLLKRKEDVVASDYIITWTTGNVGLSSLIEFARVAELAGEDITEFGFGSKAVVTVAYGQALLTSAKTAQNAFQALQPSYIVVADDNILDDVVRTQSPERFEQELSRTDSEYQIITPYTARGLGKLTPFNFMSYSMNYMINKGVPLNSLFLILMLPVIATIISTGRQLIGLKALGIFVPTVVALSFLVTGIKYGVTIFIAVLIIGTLARLLARKIRLLYLPRMAIVLSMLALALGMMFLVGAYFDKTGFIAISILPILIMTALTEHFVSVQITQGFKAAVKLALETLALSIIGYLVADWTIFKTTLLAYPELVLLTFAVNYFLGKFSGLRLTEYIRFRPVLKYMKHAEKRK